jgi:hypothetical protein
MLGASGALAGASGHRVRPGAAGRRDPGAGLRRPPRARLHDAGRHLTPSEREYRIALGNRDFHRSGYLRHRRSRPRPAGKPSGGVSAGGSAYGSGINVGKDSRRAAWSTPSPIASVLAVNVRSARRRQVRAHQRRWRRRQSRRSRPPHVVAGLPRWPPSGHLEVPIASPPRAARQGPCRGVS